MSEKAASPTYQPTDRLYLWLLTRPQQPVLIGELHLVRSLQGVSLRYADFWLQRGFPLSEDLPLIGEEFLPAAAITESRNSKLPKRVTGLDGDDGQFSGDTWRR